MNNTQECWYEMSKKNGNVLVHTDGGLAKFVDGVLSHKLSQVHDWENIVEVTGHSWAIEYYTFGNPETWSIYIEPRWENGLKDKSFICWVAKDKKLRQWLENPVAIHSYIADDIYPYKSEGAAYGSAKPLTKYDVIEFLGND